MTGHFRKKSLFFRDTREHPEHDAKNRLSLPSPSPEKPLAEIHELKKTDLRNSLGNPRYNNRLDNLSYKIPLENPKYKPHFQHYQNDLIIISDYSHLNRINPAILKNDIEEPECSFMILKSDRPMYAGADELFDKLYGAEKLMNVFPTNGLNVVSLLKEQLQLNILSLYFMVF